MSHKNGLSAIANEVLGDVQKEAEAIILAAENEAKETLKAAKEQADKSYITIIDQATEKAEAEKRRIASVTGMEMRNRLFRAKEDLVDLAFEKAVSKLRDFAKTERYHGYLLKLVEEGARKIGEKNLVVQVNAADKTWLTQGSLNRLSKKLDCELKLSDQTVNCMGGCKIQTVDGRISYDGTLDNRMEELKPVLRVEVAKILFPVET
jgi:V/A-type H+-transporting ATPase subunit E